jgi:small multidrug resistance pump
MYSYILLFFAIVAEIIATSSLKVSYGLSKLYPSLVVFAGYGLSFWLMAIVLKVLPVGVVYAIWAGLGIVGIVAISIFYFQEPFTIWHLTGISLIVLGVAVLSLLTNSH